jgi:hypothetical protein
MLTGFKTCSPACTVDGDCAIFDKNRGPFFCTADPKGNERHCRNPTQFVGSFCTKDGECPSGQVCHVYFPFREPVAGVGECRTPCPTLDVGGGCPSLGGIVHTCLDGAGKRTCYPASSGTECATTADCPPQLDCRPSAILDRNGIPTVANVCTIGCVVDSDCAQNRWTKTTFCHEGNCIDRFGIGRRCTDDKQCFSAGCAPSTLPADPAQARRCL